MLRERTIGNEGWKQNTNVLVTKSSEKKGDRRNERSPYFLLQFFIFIFLYGNVTILKNYLYVFPETRSHNKVDKFQQILKIEIRKDAME